MKKINVFVSFTDEQPEHLAVLNEQAMSIPPDAHMTDGNPHSVGDTDLYRTACGASYIGDVVERDPTSVNLPCKECQNQLEMWLEVKEV